MKKIIFIMMIVSVMFAARDTPQRSLPKGHIDGAQVSWVNAYTINVGLTNTVSTLKDSTGEWDWTFTNALQVNLTNSNAAGAYGGLARGITLTSNTLYYVYVVFRTAKPYSNVAYAVATTNATAPEFLDQSVKTNIDTFYPVTDANRTNIYTNRTKVSFRKVGSFLTWLTNATVQALPFIQNGKGRSRDTFFASSIEHQGDVTTNVSATYATEALHSICPDTATAVFANVNTTNTLTITPTAAISVGASAGVVIGDSTGGATGTSFNVLLPVSSQSFLSKTATAAGATVYITGWKEEL